MLLSYAHGEYTKTNVPDGPTIFLWDLETEIAQQQVISREDIERVRSNAIAIIVLRSDAATRRNISGRLISNAQLEIFSPSGDTLMYMAKGHPGHDPEDDEDRWDIIMHSLRSHADILVLSGHCDAIMWAGFDR